MSSSEFSLAASRDLARLDLVAEVDGLLADLRRWSQCGGDWPPAKKNRALVERLAERVGTLRVRLEAPLVVATLGGTGVGKSTLVNALVGCEVSTTGRTRPTTRVPILICPPRLTPERLGIPSDRVELVTRDAPALRDLVLLDCPDPDSTEDADAAETNLARLRELLPYCDVLLVVTTRQKYRSDCVRRELSAAAPGTRLLFVQTHAEQDDDIRDDWRRNMATEYVAGEMFFVDSLVALRDAQSGIAPRGEFGRLVDLLTRELAGSASNRIRRANFLDLLEQTLSQGRQSVDSLLPKVHELQSAIGMKRSEFAARLSERVRDELLASHRAWESRLLGEVTARWGISPFSLLLRAWHGLGGLLSSMTFWRARTPAQLALWGMGEGVRQWHQRTRRKAAERAASRGVRYSWDEAELRTAALIVEGYAHEAGLPRDDALTPSLERQASNLGDGFVDRASTELQAVVRKLADKHTGWFIRVRYELLFGAAVAMIVYRFGRNFFYDSWLAVELGHASSAHPLLGVDFWLGSGVFLLAWSGLLLAAFTARLRRGLTGEITALADGWKDARLATALFDQVDETCRLLVRYRDDLVRLEQRVGDLQRRLAQAEPQLGHRLTNS